MDVIRICHLKLALAQLRCLEFQCKMVYKEPGEALVASICDALSLSVLLFHQQQLASELQDGVREHQMSKAHVGAKPFMISFAHRPPHTLRELLSRPIDISTLQRQSN
ncbi:hypothetical protein IG631_00872 [Alternaria alternata]|nr:hypothetical protein IG631_00872 [Alternaria alternata]